MTSTSSRPKATSLSSSMTAFHSRHPWPKTSEHTTGPQAPLLGVVSGHRGRIDREVALLICTSAGRSPARASCPEDSPVWPRLEAVAAWPRRARVAAYAAAGVVAEAEALR